MLIDHCTEQKKESSKRKYPKLENHEKHIKNNGFSMVAIKKPCKTQHFQYVWLPDPLQIMKNLRKTMVFQWLLSKSIVKHNVFATFGLQDLSPEPLQNLSKIEILKN